MLSDSHFRDLVSGRWNGAFACAARRVLAALEIPYGWIVGGRNARFDRQIAKSWKVAAPVISVGNLTVGGTGKSPFVAWLARWFLDRGARVTVISRGYGSAGGRPNDEALELAARLLGVPQLQNPDRVQAAEQALAADPRQMLILDDAFQHRRLARDLDIVLLDALEPFGYGHLLPRGLLREPIESLSRAQVIALSRSDAIDENRRKEIETTVHKCAPESLWIELTHRPTRLLSASGTSHELAHLHGLRVAAFCGIGNPAGFRHTLSTCGIDVRDWLDLPDHCAFSPQDLHRIANWLELLDVQQVVCTRKDLVKIPLDELAGKRLWAVDIELEIVRGQDELEALLRQFVPARTVGQTPR
jgi:tetraacyldisaccharide 4'-kinase